MRLKSPTNTPISFGSSTGSGHSMVLGPEGEEVLALDGGGHVLDATGVDAEALSC